MASKVVQGPFVHYIFNIHLKNKNCNTPNPTSLKISMLSIEGLKFCSACLCDTCNAIKRSLEENWWINRGVVKFSFFWTLIALSRNEEVALCSVGCNTHNNQKGTKCNICSSNNSSIHLIYVPRVPLLCWLCCFVGLKFKGVSKK